MKIEWLPEADRNLTAQLEWVAERNPWAAMDMGDAIFNAIDRLADHPAMARPGRVAGTREVAVLGTPYVVVYRIEADAVVIMRILHDAQRWPRHDRVAAILAPDSVASRPEADASDAYALAAGLNAAGAELFLAAAAGEDSNVVVSPFSIGVADVGATGAASEGLAELGIFSAGYARIAEGIELTGAVHAADIAVDPARSGRWYRAVFLPDPSQRTSPKVFRAAGERRANGYIDLGRRCFSAIVRLAGRREVGSGPTALDRPLPADVSGEVRWACG